MTKIAINGFGRIGRLVLRHILGNHPNLKVAAINDLGDVKTLAHLFQYDSVYRRFNGQVQAKENSILIDGAGRQQEIKITRECDPEKLPWKELGVEIVLECTGEFYDMASAHKHLSAGAKQVIISAPAKEPEIRSFILGVNADDFDPAKDAICDMSSCTTNCLAPLVKVLDENLGIMKGFMSTIHSYTNDQRVLDGGHKDLRRARAAALNIIPTTTGAAKSIGKIMPSLNGKLDGIAFRVPTPTVSVVDLICETRKATTAQELNELFKKASQSKELKNILAVEDQPLVSSDYIGVCFSSIVDSSLTMANGNMVKVVAWYDNEYGYTCRLAEFAEYVAKKI